MGILVRPFLGLMLVLAPCAGAAEAQTGARLCPAPARCLALAGPAAPAADVAGIDATGQACALSDFKGSVILLDVSAAWCYWCQVDAPALVSLYNAYQGRGLKVVTVLTEDANGAGPCTRANLQAWSSAYGLPFRVQSDTSGAGAGTAETVYVNNPASKGFPTFVIIDQGFAVQYLQGGFDPAAIKAKLDTLLPG